MLKLCYAPGSCALASHIALEEAGADYELELVKLGEQQQRTPNDGSGPQPYINGTPAEVALNSEAQPEDGGEQRAEQVNGNGNGAQDGEEGGQRRSRRSRRGRGRPGQDRGVGDEQAASGEDGGSGDEAPAASAGNEVSDPVG